MRSMTEKIADIIYDETEDLGDELPHERCVEIAKEINDFVKMEYVKAVGEKE